MKIYAPVKDANGVWASVRFINGVGETDNPNLIKWFIGHGYTVESDNAITEKCVIDSENSVKKCEENSKNSLEKVDLESMDADELREWAKQNGFGGIIRNTKSKDKLLELLRG